MAAAGEPLAGSHADLNSGGAGSGIALKDRCVCRRVVAEDCDRFSPDLRVVAQHGLQ